MFACVAERVQLDVSLGLNFQPTLDLDVRDDESLVQPVFPGDTDVLGHNRVPIEFFSSPNFLQNSLAVDRERADQPVRVVDGRSGPRDVAFGPLPRLDFLSLRLVGPFSGRLELPGERQVVFSRGGIVPHPQDFSRLDLQGTLPDMHLLCQQFRINVSEDER